MSAEGAPPTGPSRLTAIEQSVRLSLHLSPGWLRWGGSWAVACGAAAAWPWQPGLAPVARLGAAWFLAVPLLGALGRLPADGSPERDTSSSRREAWPASALLLAMAAVSIGFLLGVGVGLLAVAGALIALARRSSADGPSRPVGILCSGYEVLLPGLIGWLALGGAISPPAALSVAEGTMWAVARWLADNGAVLAVLLAFSLVHHGATAALRGRQLDIRWWELVAGYGIAIAVLAAGDHVFAAAVVGILFVVQWPLQAAMRSGRTLWHLRHAQWLAMAAMLAATAVL